MDVPTLEKILICINFYTKEEKSNIFLHSESALPWSQKVATIHNEARNQEALKEKLRADSSIAQDLSESNRSNISRCKVHYLDLPFLREAAERRILKAFDRKEINVRPVYYDLERRASKIGDSTVHLDLLSHERSVYVLCRELRIHVQDHMPPCGRHHVGFIKRPLHERIREHDTCELLLCYYYYLL